MGARQSVAQPPRQRNSSTAVSADLANAGPTSGQNGGGATNSTSPHFTNGHTFGEPSTSGEGGGGGHSRTSVAFQHPSQQAPRPRQTRSRSVPMPPPADGIRASGLGVAASHQSGQQQHHYHHHHGHPQRHQQYRPHHFPIVARDQSSDSSGGAENETDTVTTGITSLDRLLRLNSAVSAASAAGTGTGATAVWLPFALRQSDMKCPVCSKMVPSDDVEYHLVVCLTRPKIAYNEDVSTEDKGECVICFEEMSRGDTIARLPCLCVYHKTCIDSWFKVKNSCPEHPGDD